MTPTNSPLTEQDYQRLKNGLDANSLALQRADMAQRAGLDVTSTIATLQQQRDQIQKILNVYFPGR